MIILSIPYKQIDQSHPDMILKDKVLVHYFHKDNNDQEYTAMTMIHPDEK